MKKFLKKILRKKFPIIYDYNSAGIKYKVGRAKRILLMLHFIFCYLSIHCSPDEYWCYKFYRVKHSERKKFYLSYHQRKKISLVNAKGATRVKSVIAKRFSAEFGRAFVCLDDCDAVTFTNFLKEHKKLILKPDKGSCGREIEVVSYKTDEEAAEIYSKFINREYICEEYILQHHFVAAVNPGTVNTVRCVSVNTGEQIKVIGAVFRAGRGDKCVDNLRMGGIGANIDVQTGIINTCGKDYNGNLYDSHPISGFRFLGSEIPFWQEIVKTVKGMHGRFEECAILGWDIAITETGPVLVEVNNAPVPMNLQFIDKVPKGEEIIKVLKKKEKQNKKKTK